MGSSDQGVQASTRRYLVIPRMLTFLFNGSDVLLLKGAPDKRIWANRYNGVGGHIEAHEDAYAAALRETREETGLDIARLDLRGIINIDAGHENDAGARTGIILFVFSGCSPSRQTRPSREGTLEWVPLDRLGSYDLVEDVPVLLDRILNMPDDASPFFARYAYDAQDQLHITFADQRQALTEYGAATRPSAPGPPDRPKP